jgi:hypothetical protein
VNGQPNTVSVGWVQCFDNGHGSPGGACVDDCTGTNVTIANSTDSGSQVGFIADYWGGATGSMSKLMTSGNVWDGYWIGAPGFALTKLSSSNAGRHGMWLDWAASNGGTLDDFTSTGSQEDGILIAASGWTIQNATVSGYNGAGSHFAGFDVGGYGENTWNGQAIPPPTGVSISANAGSHQFNYGPGQMTIWQGQRVGDGYVFLIMQTDGNLVAYTNNGTQAVWASGTTGKCSSSSSCFATYQSDGNFVIYNNYSPIWATGSNGSVGLTIADTSPFVRELNSL